jgi:phenylacetic acid degradation operon negative regulatory protein
MKPANIILDLLRTYAERGTSVRNIMATGAMFGFSENQMRVNLSRLAARQIIENFSRGCYRLNGATDPLNEFIEDWRLGEARVRPWRKTWLLAFAAADSAPDQTAAIDRSNWALGSHGFRAVAPHCWIRPDNLALSHDDLEQRLQHLGLSMDTGIASNAHISALWQSKWRAQFDPQDILQRYQEALAALTQSLNGLQQLPRPAAMKETFNLGGQAIQLLAKDPLLPAEMLDPATRAALWQLMLDYDRQGRDIWADAEAGKPRAIPTAQLAFH